MSIFFNKAFLKDGEVDSQKKTTLNKKKQQQQLPTSTWPRSRHFLLTTQKLSQSKPSVS